MNNFYDKYAVISLYVSSCSSAVNSMYTLLGKGRSLCEVRHTLCVPKTDDVLHINRREMAEKFTQKVFLA